MNWVIYDDKGVIWSGPDEDEARTEFSTMTDFTGDLVLAQVHAVRR